jgi:subtilisin family serine protease
MSAYKQSFPKIKLIHQMDNLDAALRLLLLQHNEQQKERTLNPADTEGSSPALSGEKVRVFLTYQDDLKPIQDLGYELRSFTDNITTGDISLKQLAAIASHPNVLRIEIVRKGSLMLNNSIPEIHANDPNVRVRSGDTFTGFTGRGVIICIIDSGIDIYHPSFRHTDSAKTTRILSLWDQYPAITPEPANGGILPASVQGIATVFGIEYKTDVINDALKSSPTKVVNQKDKVGHGTHVAGIAAGNGSQNGHCHGAYTYIGVAPEADLIVVKIKEDASDEDVLNAMLYIIDRTEKTIPAKKVVFNLSWGYGNGSRDGKTTLESGINRLLQKHPNNFMGVISAGNQGGLDYHAEGIVPHGNSIELKFIQMPTNTPEFIEIWYQLPHELKCSMIPPNGSETTPVVSINTNNKIFNNTNGTNGTVTIDTMGTNPVAAFPTIAATTFNPIIPATVAIPATATLIWITLTPPPSGNNLSSTNETPWVIKLANQGASDVPFHAWIPNNLPNGQPKETHTRFSNFITDKTILSTPSTTERAICVANYRIDSVQDSNTKVILREAGSLDDTSNRGPTRDGLFQKPNLAAPGVAIVSANVESKDRLESCCCNCCKDFYQERSGTSMSAPHVTGTIALMWQKNPNLTAQEIKDKLIASARHDSNTTNTDDWGAGKLDVKAALEPTVAAPAAPPIAVPLMASRETPQYNPLQTLQERFLASPKGGYLLKVGQKHFNEIRNLINANKRVATVWHRCEGPAWLRTGFSILSMPDMVIPEAIANVKLTEAVRKLTEILTRYGSPELVNDIEMYQPDLQILRGGVSVFDLAENFEVVTK